MGDARTEGAFAIIAEIGNAWHLTHVSTTARHAGVSVGQGLADARAICPDLLTEPADPGREHMLLRALWRWADQWSPRVTLDGPDGLLLDITGCAHLFGGEAAMAQAIGERLGDMQVAARTGIADTRIAARALARFGSTAASIASPGQTRQALAPLPVAAINLTPALVHELARTGLETVGQLYPLKPAELNRRFGLELTRALAGSLGHVPDPVPPATRDPVYAARMTLPDPVGFRSDIESVLHRLMASVCGRLSRDRKGARRFRLTVHCVDTGNHVLTAGFAQPCAEPAVLQQQFARPLDQLRITFGADWFRLVAEDIEPVRPRQLTLDGASAVSQGTSDIITTLGNRLGFDRVLRFCSCNSHLPECEFTIVEAADMRSGPAWAPVPRKRPLRLFRQPERLRLLDTARPPGRFEWRRHTYRTTTSRGPERLSMEWWRGGDPRLRDYWAVQTAEGDRLWLLTYPGTAQSDWYVAGRFP